MVFDRLSVLVIRIARTAEKARSDRTEPTCSAAGSPACGGSWPRCRRRWNRSCEDVRDGTRRFLPYEHLKLYARRSRDLAEEMEPIAPPVEPERGPPSPRHRRGPTRGRRTRAEPSSAMRSGARGSRRWTADRFFRWRPARSRGPRRRHLRFPRPRPREAARRPRHVRRWRIEPGEAAAVKALPVVVVDAGRAGAAGRPEEPAVPDHDGGPEANLDLPAGTEDPSPRRRARAPRGRHHPGPPEARSPPPTTPRAVTSPKLSAARSVSIAFQCGRARSVPRPARPGTLERGRDPPGGPARTVRSTSAAKDVVIGGSTSRSGPGPSELASPEAADAPQVVQHEHQIAAPAGRGRRGCRGRTGRARPGPGKSVRPKTARGRSRRSAKTTLRPRLFQQVRSPRATTRPMPGGWLLRTPISAAASISMTRTSATARVTAAPGGARAPARVVVLLRHGAPDGHVRGSGRNPRRLTRCCRRRRPQRRGTPRCMDHHAAPGSESQGRKYTDPRRQM